jgi:hypothetical protein
VRAALNASGLAMPAKRVTAIARIQDYNTNQMRYLCCSPNLKHSLKIIQGNGWGNTADLPRLKRSAPLSKEPASSSSRRTVAARVSE